MLKVEFTGQFKRDYKLAVKRGCNPAELEKVILCFAANKLCLQNIVNIILLIPVITKICASVILNRIGC